MDLSGFNVKLSRAELRNGMPLVVFERPGMPISLKVAFFNGSRFDPVGKEGLAHFAEHMMVSGTEKFPTKHDIGTHVESFGASFNASTSSDKMDVYIDFADSEDAEKAVNLLDQFIQHSVHDPSTIERERGAILAELAGKKSDPGVYIYRLWKLAAYQQSLLARDTIGTEESITAISRDDLLKYHQQQLNSRPAAIVASGGMTASYLAKLFNNTDFILNRKFSESSDIQVQRIRQSPILTKRYPNSEQAHIALGFPTIPETHEDFWALYVLSRLLGSGRTSRLQQKLRNERGLVYSVHTGLDSWYESGSMATFTSCKTDNVDQVLEVIAEELRKIATEGVSELELAHKKNFLTKFQLLRMQTSSAWVGYHTDTILKYPERTDTIATEMNKINSISIQQVQSVAQKYFQADTWYLAVCGDVSENEITFNF